MLGRCIGSNPKVRQAMSNSKSLEIMRRPYERVLIPEAEGATQRTYLSSKDVSRKENPQMKH